MSDGAEVRVLEARVFVLERCVKSVLARLLEVELQQARQSGRLQAASDAEDRATVSVGGRVTDLAEALEARQFAAEEGG